MRRMLHFSRAHTKMTSKLSNIPIMYYSKFEARLLTFPRVPPLSPNMPPVMLSVTAPVGAGVLELLTVTVLDPRQLGKEKPACRKQVDIRSQRSAWRVQQLHWEWSDASAVRLSHSLEQLQRVRNCSIPAQRHISSLRQGRT